MNKQSNVEEIFYIPADKIKTYLKLGKSLVQFVRWDRFFGRPTFDWIKLEAAGNLYKASLIRSLDEGDRIFTDVLSFHTLNEEKDEFDELENPFLIGDWEAAWNWMQQYDADPDRFMKPEDLSKLYLEFKTRKR